MNIILKKFKLALLIMGVFVVIPVYAHANINSSFSTPPNNLGLVGRWTFDGKDMVSNVHDSSGYGNDGRLLGFTSTTTEIGKHGQALRFDGGTNRVDAGNDPSIQLTTQGTLMAWIKADPSQTGSWPGIVCDSDIDSDFNGYCLYMTGAGFISLELDDAAGGYNYSQTSQTFNDNKWHFAVATWDGTNLKTYVDGNLLQTVAQTITPAPGAYNLHIGSTANESSFFKGLIDDARVYNRALSIFEIKQLYNSGQAKIQASSDMLAHGSSLESGLVGHWTFDGKDMVSNVADSSGSGHNGNLFGQPSTTTEIGKIGQALKLTGSNQYVDMGDFLDAPTDITTSAWIKLSSGSSDMRAIISKMGSYLSGAGWTFLVSGDVGGGTVTNTLMFFVQDAGGSNWNQYRSDATLNIGSWVYVAATLSGGANGVITLYVNGVAVPKTSLGSGTVGSIASAATVKIGNSDDFTQQFLGDIDDPRVYSRALSAAEIKQLYQLGH